METNERIKLHGILRLTGIVVILLVGGSLYLGISTARNMRAIIRDRYNQQQLVLARASAFMVEASFRNATSDLALLSSFSSIQSVDFVSDKAFFLSAMSILGQDDIIEFRKVDPNGNLLFLLNKAGMELGFSGRCKSEDKYLAWASDVNNRGKTMGSKVYWSDFGGGRRCVVLDLVIAIYKQFTNGTYPHEGIQFAGYLCATLDVGGLLHRICQPITSGKTGYAWVIDASGNFLYHPEGFLVGEDAFTIRHASNLDESVIRINDLQRKNMREGKEGVGIYFSGWQRKGAEPIEKIIAYTPLQIRCLDVSHQWSVAVVTPAHEIDGMVNWVYVKQILLQCLVVFIIVLCTVSILLYEVRWSAPLEEQVAVRTKDMKRYIKELELSEAKYRSLVESAEDFIFTVDRHGTIQTANAEMIRRFSIDGDPLDGQKLSCFMEKEKADEQMDLIRKTVETGDGQWMETSFRFNDRSCWFNIRYIPFKGGVDDGKLALCIGRDITDRKRLEEQCMRDQKLASLGTLAGGVAHELNNPLGIILGFCELLLEKTEPKSSEYDDLKTIEKHGLHCKCIVENLLRFAQISEEEDAYCDVNAIISAVLSDMRPVLSQREIQLIVALTDGLPKARGNPRQLGQAFFNLLQNAVQAMNGQGKLGIITRLGADAHRLEILVSDNGHGIREESRQRIFDPFYTTRDVGGGMGLGLSVTHGIISKYGGTVSCESHTEEEVRDNLGTTFTVSLPVTETLPMQIKRRTSCAT
ncbi:sensor histidine kinase [Desulforhabdus sp. TSK]|uniref:sensor histidine kinase n=1 Tax=Desulforhabdus sp. TSK TaxID=2925014 RepID=UPI001FC7F743|nr:sensor histidine kinase [Desulforhabdus sp. TSK]GKT09994.1 sensor histidine kinase [Desulforhabdus sp. TSK]